MFKDDVGIRTSIYVNVKIWSEIEEVEQVRLGIGRTFADRTGPASNGPVEILDLTGNKRLV
jgi:hypothetical protein